MTGYLFTLPSTTDILVAIGEVSSPIFEEFKPFLFFILGITLGIGMVYFLINLFKKSFNR